MKKAITIILVCIAILASLLLIVGCTQTHTHSYVQKKATKEYLLSAATCTEKARYFYSCECGAMCPDFFEYGDYADHPYSDEWSKNETTHWHQSTCIHNVKSDEAEHNFVNNTCTVCKYVTTKEHDEYVGFTFLLDGDSYTLTKYSGTKTTVTVPSSYSGKPVTIIGERAFYDCSKVVEIRLPNTIIEIGSEAFGYCISLKNVQITACTRVKERAFVGCVALTDVSLPNGLISIGQNLFAECSRLKSVTINSGIISDKVFANCYGVKRIVLGSGVTDIAKYAFAQCTALESLTLPRVNENESFNSYYFGLFTKQYTMYGTDSDGLRPEQVKAYSYVVDGVTHYFGLPVNGTNWYYREDSVTYNGVDYKYTDEPITVTEWEKVWEATVGVWWQRLKRWSASFYYTQNSSLKELITHSTIAQV